MKVSAELRVQAKIVPKLKLGSKTPKGVVGNGVHKVKLLSDKIVKGKDFKTGKEIDKVEYTLEENGEKKIYTTKLKNDKGELSYLVQNLADFQEGEEVFMEMKKAGMKNFVNVWSVNEPKTAEVDEEMDEMHY